MLRYLFFALFFFLVGCFNKSKVEVESEPIGVCGNYSRAANQVPDVFKAQCATCHHFEKDMTGPKMSGILERVPSEEWLRNFITHQDSLVAARDSVALKIMDQSPVKLSHNFSNLESRDLDTLMKYITQ
jgi:hypothetical protein